MTVQFSAAVRNAMLDAFESSIGATPTLELRTGAAPADCATASSGTVLATIALPSDWMAAAASGAKGLAGTWEDTLADATGVAGHFRIFQGATCHVQGTVTIAGGGGDMELVNPNIAVNQPISISDFDLTINGA